MKISRVPISLYAILILASLLLLQPRGAAFSAPPTEPLVGTVDLDSVYAFHPLMQYYDPSLGRFIKPVEGSPSAKEFSEVVAARNAEYQKVREKGMAGMAKIRSDIEKCRAELSSVESRISAESVKAVEPVKEELLAAKTPEQKLEKQKKLHEALMRESSRNASETARINASIEELSGSYLKLQRSLVDHFYLSSAEGEKLVERVNAEISAAVASAAAKTGVKAVLNSRRPASAGAAAKAEGMPADASEMARYDEILSKGPDYSNILGMLSPDASSDGAPDRVKRILDSKRPSSTVNFGGEVLMGGKDITPAVLLELLSKYKVPAGNIEKIVELVSESARGRE